MVCIKDWQKEKLGQIALKDKVLCWWETASQIPQGLASRPVVNISMSTEEIQSILEAELRVGAIEMG